MIWKINELRRNNYVLIPVAESNTAVMPPVFPAKIQSVGIFGDMQFLSTPEHEGVTFHINRIAPIPITEDLFPKCGLENEPEWHSTSKGDNEKVFHLNPTYSRWCGVSNADISIAFDVDENKWRLLNDVYGDREYSCFGIELAGLHHLQNLVLDLTGKELEIKL